MIRYLLSLSALVTLAASPATAASDDTIIYVVKRGDNLITLGKRYLISDTGYLQIQKVNAVRDPNVITIGTRLRIPRNLLRYNASSAELVAVRGNVTIARAGASNVASKGISLSEGATIRTASSSFATLSLENGSRVSLPSNSDLRIIRLRRYVIDSSLDYDFAVGRGGASSKVAPLKNPNDRYVVKTPKAVSAVRGTDFQSRYDEAGGKDFAEVTEGGLAVDLDGGGSTPLPAGNGLAVKADGGVIKEALLPSMTVPDAGQLQKDKIVSFALPKADGVMGARVTLASDAGFVDQAADATFTGNAATFQDIDDGNYFVRIRPVSANGIEGLPVTYGFKRRQNAVSASASASDKGYAFKWLADGKGVLRYHFQLYRGQPTGVPMVDEAGLKEQQISLSDLPPSDYYWRVASVQYVDGEVFTNWTPFEKLTVSAE
jgi:hypothetical protein